MNVIPEDGKRRIAGREDLTLSLDNSGLYLIKIAARASGKENLRVEIDGRKFSDSPAVFAGSKLKGLKETIFFILPLNSGRHIVSLVPDQGVDLEGFKVASITDNQININDQAEDGDRRPWVTFVLVDLALVSVTPTITYSRRKRDSDDVKIIIDGKTQGNVFRTIKHFLWHFAGSFLPKGSSKTETETFTPNFSQGLHYIEFWADRMPSLQNISFTGLMTDKLVPAQNDKTIEDKIRRRAQEYGLDSELMVRIARRESQFKPDAVSSKGAKGIFQLTNKAIEQINILGFEVKDPFDFDQNIQGAMIYFKWLYEMYEGDPERLEKTLAAWNWGQGNFSKDEPLDYGPMPDETINFINYVLNK